MRTRREGFTFVEMLMVALLGSLLIMAIYQTLTVQERSYRQFGAVISTHQATRIALEVLAGELREISSTDADLVYASEDTITFRALRKFGVVCDTVKGSRYIHVAQLGTETFHPGDSIFVYLDGNDETGADDVWDWGAINAVAPGTCTGNPSGDIYNALNADTLVEIRLPAGAPFRMDSVDLGAPVRSFVWLTYGAKHWGGTWYLARAEAADSMVPIVGPLASPSRGGLVFVYYDTLDAALTSFPLSAADRERVHRIRIEIRGERATGIGGADSTYLDSLITDIFIRGS